jgi:glycosyltransferase involved in cell wall biosynthesis
MDRGVRALCDSTRSSLSAVQYPTGAGFASQSAMAIDGGLHGPDRLVVRLPGRVAIWFVAATAIETLRQAMALDETPGATRYAIVYPLWTLPQIASGLVSDLETFDEVWAPSGFVRDALADAIRRPVFHMPVGVDVGPVALQSRVHFGITGDAYMFLTEIDMVANLDQQNVHAVVHAFRRARTALWPSRVSLAVHVSNGDIRPDVLRSLRAELAGDHDDILWLEGSDDGVDLAALLRLTDCFVSLHRSTAHEPNVVRAQALGKPVIVTGFGGTSDTCDASDSFLVDHALVAVPRRAHRYGQDQVWAEPSIESATAAMVDLASDRALGRQVGEAARGIARQRCSHLACGLALASRLEDVARLIGHVPSSGASALVSSRGQRS